MKFFLQIFFDGKMLFMSIAILRDMLRGNSVLVCPLFVPYHLEETI